MSNQVGFLDSFLLIFFFAKFQVALEVSPGGRHQFCHQKSKHVSSLFFFVFFFIFGKMNHKILTT